MERRTADGALARHRLRLLLLCACAGSVDLLSITRLGGAITGVLTGDLVNTADDVALDRWALIRFPAVVIGAFCLGVAVWSYGLRTATSTSRAHRSALLAELALLLLIPAGLAATHGHPDEVPSMALLAVAAAAMGAQSTICLLDGVSTTYMTGTITSAIRDLVRGGPVRDPLNALARPFALLAGVAATAVLLSAAWWAAAPLPSLLVAGALLADRADPPPAGDAT